MLRPTPRLSQEGTEEILHSLYHPAGASPAVVQQRQKVIALTKALKAKEEKKTQAKKLALR